MLVSDELRNNLNEQATNMIRTATELLHQCLPILKKGKAPENFDQLVETLHLVHAIQQLAHEMFELTGERKSENE